MALDLETRYALYVVGGRKCVWCGRPILFKEMEAEHLIPKSLEGDELRRVLTLHGLPPDYDLEALRNRAPACGPCNGSKSARIPPDQPIITMMLESAAARAPAVERRAKARMTRRQVEEAIAHIEMTLSGEPDPDVRELLQHLGEQMSSALKDASRDGEAEVAVEFHPALSLLWNPAGRWRLAQALGPHAVLVTDGKQAGVVGSDITYMCGNCGSYGPWSGARCLTCGHLSDPWD